MRPNSAIAGVGGAALSLVLATGLALIPLVVNGQKPGQEIEYPLAVVILGGLVTSTLLNLFLLPPVYAVLGGDKARVGRRSDATARNTPSTQPAPDPVGSN